MVDQSVCDQFFESLITEGVLERPADRADGTAVSQGLAERDYCGVCDLSPSAAVIMMNLVGQTINIMTLSGMALAIGVLVDQARYR